MLPNTKYISQTRKEGISMCNEEPRIERCIICPKHCECEAESEAFSTDDFEQYRSNLKGMHYDS